MKNKKILLLLTAVTIVSVVIAYSLSVSNPSEENNKRESYAAGFNQNTKVIISNISKGSIETESITVSGSKKTLLNNLTLDQNTGSILTVRDGKNNFDIETITNNKNIIINYKNLPLNSQITLFQDGSPIHENVPVDWVGNLVLTASNDIYHLCNQIYRPELNANQTICYNVNQEGQS